LARVNNVLLLEIWLLLFFDRMPYYRMFIIFHDSASYQMTMAKRHHEPSTTDSSGDDPDLTSLLPLVRSSNGLTGCSSKRMRDKSPTENNCNAVYVVTRAEMMAYFTLLGKKECCIKLDLVETTYLHLLTLCI
jgi:hypothetical protein